MSNINLSETQINALFEQNVWGELELSRAIRPCSNGIQYLKRGYCIREFAPPELDRPLPFIMTSESCEAAFELFIKLVESLGQPHDFVTVAIEASHRQENGKPLVHYGNEFELLVLPSKLESFKDELIHDGCLGVVMMHQEEMCEIHFDEHKIVYIYAFDLAPFLLILEQHGLKECSCLDFIIDGEHVHLSDVDLLDALPRLLLEFGADQAEY